MNKLRFLEPVLNVRNGIECERISLVLTSSSSNKVIANERLHILSTELNAINNMFDYIYNTLISTIVKTTDLDLLITIVVKMFKLELQELKESTINNPTKVRYGIEYNAIQKVLTEYEVYQKTLQLTCANCGQTFITNRFEQSKFCKECKAMKMTIGMINKIHNLSIKIFEAEDDDSTIKELKRLELKLNE